MQNHLDMDTIWNLTRSRLHRRPQDAGRLVYAWLFFRDHLSKAISHANLAMLERALICQQKLPTTNVWLLAERERCYSVGLREESMTLGMLCDLFDGWKMEKNQTHTLRILYVHLHHLVQWPRNEHSAFFHSCLHEVFPPTSVWENYAMPQQYLLANDSAVLHLATLISQKQEPLHGILADALEDCGGAFRSLVSHLRLPHPDVRPGIRSLCWVVRFLLGEYLQYQ